MTASDPASSDLLAEPGLLRSRYTALLMSIVLMLLVLPLLRGWSQMEQDWVQQLSFALILAGVIYAIRPKRGRHWFLAIVGLAFVGNTLDKFIPVVGTTLLGYAAAAIFEGYVTVLILRRVIARGTVSTERIVAALCAFLMIGMFWASLYSLMYVVDPSVIQHATGRALTHSDLTYFSYVTLTTLGYGDITPHHPLAQSLAYLEAATGQLFIAVVIARLVALQIIDSARAIAHDEIEEANDERDRQKAAR